jgi:3-mercaptopyruvate sulfurtransferase SseA
VAALLGGWNGWNDAKLPTSTNLEPTQHPLKK